VLWIGFLQWHIRAFGNTSVAEPVVLDYGNIEHRDAVLAYDDVVPMRDEAGTLVTRWDGVTFKVHPVTGEQVPDEAAQVPQWTYVNPRQAEWPAADFIVGNPPFIGGWRIRQAHGDGYVQALWSVYPEVPQKADFVMYWWDRAADVVRAGDARAMGLITTNSITQVFQRRVLKRHLDASGVRLSLVYAIADHPWVEITDGAAVRIAMTVARAGDLRGRLLRCDDGDELRLVAGDAKIYADLQVGADITSIVSLSANQRVSSPGVQLYGSGFILDRLEAERLRNFSPDRPSVVRSYVNGRDINQKSRDVFVIDFFGMSESEARSVHPMAFQHILDRVKPERDVNEREAIRRLWWRFGWERPALRHMVEGLSRYVVTVETSKHRIFLFLGPDVLPDNMLTVIASEEARILGVLSSCAHVEWTLATGGTLEDRPRYNKSVCFDTFPFPSDDTGLTPALTDRIRQLAEQLDAHRKARQAAHEAVTLTGMYNVLEKLRSGEALTERERVVHGQGLVSVLRTLHDDLDAAVLEAYGWGDLRAALADYAPAAAEARAAAVETLLERLVALNAKRAAEEAAGTVRWLRPEFQLRQRGGEQARIETGEEEAEAAVDPPAPVAPAAPVVRRPWPTGLPEQIKAVADVLAGAPAALALADIEARFTARGRWRDRLPTILDTLEALGRARRDGEAWRGT